MAKRNIPKGPFWKFALVDLAVIAAALALAFLIRFQEFRPENLNIYVQLAPLIVFIRLGSLFAFRLYDFSQPLTVFDIVYTTFWAMAVSHGLESLLLLYTGTYIASHSAIGIPPLIEDATIERSFQVSRYIMALNFIASWALTAVWRTLYLYRRRRWGYDRTRMLIVGAGPMGESVLRDVEQYSRLGHEVVGLVDDDLEQTLSQTKVLGKISDLPVLVEREEIDEIIVTSRRADRQTMLEILTACRATGCEVHLLPELYEVTIGQVEIGQVAGIPLIRVGMEPWSDWRRFSKRLFDAASAAASLIVLSPLFVLVALAIRLDSPGPAFYRQTRIGKDGAPFRIVKFRTMKKNAERETGPVMSDERDERVTRVGRWLRFAHLDELPQLWNVLRGEMSLVGPRPERPHFVDQYARALPLYRLRERVRPGMTGLAQIHGFYNSPVEHKLRYDIAYINNMTFLLDIKILFNTLKVSLTGRGAR
ncbi:MAG: exopolysaccharide biosynthesis polyprenyl glycosylphosphotransferase [bacterium]|nr:exopolysaccharide biosynthesis polyprenyl glycosylphosphotransferase [bacterium]